MTATPAQVPLATAALKQALHTLAQAKASVAPLSAALAAAELQLKQAREAVVNAQNVFGAAVQADVDAGV